MLRGLYLHFTANILDTLAGFLDGYVGGDQGVAMAIAFLAYQWLEQLALGEGMARDVLIYLASM